METHKHPTSPLSVVVVPHTHWDREWYRTFQAFRTRLVDTLDTVIDALESGRLPHFLLDGQTVMLEDYLTIRPERRERLTQLVTTGKLGIGPWYILPDEFLVSGESLIRNLLFGTRLTHSFGGQATIGYLPDMFGHVAQMPQILAGFGMHRAVVWRGVDPKQERFWWKAPSGLRLATTFLPTGYCNCLLWADMPAAQRATKFHEFVAAHQQSPMLLLSGCDHLAPRANLADVVAGLAAGWSDGTVRLGRMSDALGPLPEPADEVAGELRQGGRAYLLPDVLSARTYLKQANAEVQTQWERYVEPLQALLALEGRPEPEGYWAEGWRKILLNQPHDSICGCSVDSVHREMLSRFSEARELGEALVSRALYAFSPAGSAPGAVVYNPLGWERTDWVKIALDWPLAEAPEQAHLVDEAGRRIACSLDKVEDTEVFHADSTLFPDWHQVRRFHFTALIEEAPAMGVRRLYGRPEAPEPLDFGVAHGPNSIANEHLRLFVKDGALILEDLDTGAQYPDVHVFEDGGDAGDEYTYSPPVSDTLVEGQLEHWLVERVTSTEAVLRVAARLEMPEKITEDRRSRARRMVSTIVLSRFTLRAGSRLLEVETELDNRARDHRLRVRFGTGLTGPITMWTENQFWVTERSTEHPVVVLPVPPLAEMAPATFPQQGWSALEGDVGLLVAGIGLHEVEVGQDPAGAWALRLTLLRSVGWLSRDDLRTRGGGAGPHFETPDAQCLGPQRFRYAISPYRGGWSAAQPAALGFAAPLRSQVFGGAVASLAGALPAAKWLSISDERLVLSTVKRAAGGDGVVVRLYNPTDREIETQIEVHRDIREIALATMAEEAISTLGDRVVVRRVAAGEILTLLVR